MLRNCSPLIVALLAAYCALASPVNTQPNQVQAVIDALKAQLKAQLKANNITDISAAVDEAEASLWANGVLNDEIFAMLGQEIQTLTTEGGMSVDAIAEHTFEYLNAKGSVDKPDQVDTASFTAVPDTLTIKQVVDHGIKYWKDPCPDGSQATLCCVIL